MLIVPTILVHFDKSKSLLLACYASLYAVGTILSHVMDNHSDNTTVPILPETITLLKS